VALHRREQKHEPVFFREFFHGAVEMRLKFARGRHVLCRRPRRRLRPKRFAHFAALRGTRSINRQTKRYAYEPGAEPRAITQAFKAPIRAKQRFLRHIFRICAVAQNTARDAKRQRPALREPLLKFTAESSRNRFLRELIFGGTAWLDQNQLLH
jgi:hypothetical protein